MAEPPFEMKPNIDEPDIAQPNVVEPANILVNTANYFFKCEKYKVRDEMIEWCKKEAIMKPNEDELILLELFLSLKL